MPLLETFFGKINESLEDPPQAGPSGHSSTYHAKRKIMEGVDTLVLPLFIPASRKRSQVTFISSILILNFFHSQVQIHTSIITFTNLFHLFSQV